MPVLLDAFLIFFLAAVVFFSSSFLSEEHWLE